MSHTIYVTRIIPRPLSALFGLQFMLPIEKSVTFTGACALASSTIKTGRHDIAEILLKVVLNTIIQSIK